MHDEAFFFDGTSARRRSVRLVFQTDGIDILEAGDVVASWRFADLRLVDARNGVLRLTAAGAAELARLELRDPALVDAIGARCPELKQRKRIGDAGTGRIVFWSLAAAASLILTVVYLVPLIADRLAPLVPIALEARLGDAVDGNIRALYGKEACGAGDGQAALDRLGARLTEAAALPVPVSISVLPSEVPNAVALPGGRVYVFDGLLALAESPDELAGVIAHELGHVAGRDGLRALLQHGGSAFLIGLVFGDVTGGGAIVLGAELLVDNRYSRHAEAAADAFAAALMARLGRPSAGLGVLLARMQSGHREPPAFLSSHPLTAERREALEASSRPATGAPLLDADGWKALKGICGDA